LSISNYYKITLADFNGKSNKLEVMKDMKDGSFILGNARFSEEVLKRMVRAMSYKEKLSSILGQIS